MRARVLHHPDVIRGTVYWKYMFFIHAHTHKQARDVYEESIQTVTTVRDFGQVFDAYAQFEESMINAKMETTAEMGATEDGMGAWLGCG